MIGLLLTGCHKLESFDDPDVGQTFSAEVTPEDGGTLETASGQFSLAFPSGAVFADTTVTVDVLAPANGSLTATYELGPDGTLFNAPLVLGIEYGPVAELTDGSRFPVIANDAMEGVWVPLLDSAPVGTRIVATTTHFSAYAVVSVKNESDAWFQLFNSSVQVTGQAVSATGRPAVHAWFEDAAGNRTPLAEADPLNPSQPTQPSGLTLGPGRVFLTDGDGTDLDASLDLSMAPSGIYDLNVFDGQYGEVQFTMSRVELPAPDIAPPDLIAFFNLGDSPTVALYDMSTTEPTPLALGSNGTVALFQKGGDFQLGIDQDLDTNVDLVASLTLGDNHALASMYFTYAHADEGFPVEQDGYVLVVGMPDQGTLVQPLTPAP